MTEKVYEKLDFLEFQGSWRKYQSRVLQELENYLDDKKLNVVAAPGAGKTTLGIEVISRLGYPALIIAPTITIRNQWKERICDAFLKNKYYENYISLDAKNIKPITVITYQLLHSVCKYQETLDIFVEQLKKNNVKTVVLDEAHHLRTEWYQSIKTVCEMLDDKPFRTVSLTGTPPYDVPRSEWNNYHNLSGPVDVEISIPELVKQGDLCPHQDLIWFSELDEDDEKILADFENNRLLFFNYLNNDPKFYSLIKTSPMFDNLEKNCHLIYEDTNFTLSVISYLFFHDELDILASTLMNFICIDRENIPLWTYETAQTLLNGILCAFEPYFDKYELLKEKLKKYKLLESAKRVNLVDRLSIKKVFSRSKSKIKSIEDITNIEYSYLKSSLREVVLLDYISSENMGGMNVLSVFDKLKNQKYSTGILSGTLVVIPKSAKEGLLKISNYSEKIVFSEYQENYLKIDAKGNYNLVSVITELFYQGYINVLIGTQALLGEGWDSPCVNCLIIASVVGSFMLSNQMRGRAIRIDKNNPNKTANIWHLVSVAKFKNDYLKKNYDDNDCDMDLIYNRFKTFEGISFVDNTIQNGLDRLGIPCASIKEKNEVFASRATQREQMIQMWSQVFEKSVITEENYVSQVYNVIKSERPKMPVLFVKHQENWCFKNFIIPFFMKYKTKQKQKYTNVLIDGVLSALCDLGIIKTEKSKIVIKNIISSDYTPYVTITNCSNYEREVFINTFEELYSIPENQRYILRHEDKYLTVPDFIGVNKKSVKIFTKYIEQYFGYLDIIYTRSMQGRKELLKSRFNPLVDEQIKTNRIWI